MLNQSHFGRACLGLGLAVLTFLLFAGYAQAQDPTKGRDLDIYVLRPVYLPEAKRPDTRYDLKQLPFKQVGGQLPTFDGEQFQINLFDQNVDGDQAAAELVSNLLRGLQSPLNMEKELRRSLSVTTAKADSKFIEEEVKKGQEVTQRSLSGRFKSLSKGSTDLMEETAAEVRKQGALTVSVFRFDQFLDEVRIDNTALVAHSTGRGGIVSLHGRFYNDVTPTNKSTLKAEDAQRRAVASLQKKYQVREIKLDGKPELVLLPYGEAFRYCWRTMFIVDGPYETWIDAESGDILQLLPRFYFSDNAKGLAFNPNPTIGTKEMTFEVDPPSGGFWTLNLAGSMTMSNSAADGATGIVQVSDDGSGTANFNVAPINGTVVERTSQAGYNGLFQQVNVYAHTFNERRYYELLGANPIGVVNLTVNQGGVDNAFPNSFFVGTATTGNSVACGSLFNSGIDATIVAHEFGHVLISSQVNFGGGTQTLLLHEGMADYWGCSFFNMDVCGGWWAHNCAAPTQSGSVPRQLEPLDVFPEHNSLPGASNEQHSAGQMVGWANWSYQQGMNQIIKYGRLSADINVIQALPTTGIGVLNNGTDKATHDVYVDMLRQQAPLLATSRSINKLLAGYARAGFFLSDKDAIIDISDNYLDRASATGPLFTIWTGRDYTFSGNTVSTATQPFNTEFMVEVANDVAFTSNLVSSGWLGGVVAGAGGTATWQLPNADWNTLKVADNLYYRVSTRTAGGGNERQSWNPGNGFLLNTPVGKAAINGTGSVDCSCSASSGNNTTGMALIPILPLLGLAIYRFTIRRKKNADASQDR